jgi:hypothetical protein
MKKLLLKHLPIILQLLEHYSFRKVAELIGLESEWGGDRIRGLLRRNGIDPKLYSKSRVHHNEQRFWQRDVGYRTEPRLLRVYYHKGHAVKVYESRYAAGI